MTIEGALIAGLSGLTAAVGVLFRLHHVHFRRIIKKLDDCEEDRRKLWRRIDKIESKS